MVIIKTTADMEKTAPSIKQCLIFLNENGGTKISLGRHDIDDSDMYVNVVEYTTKEKEESVWEAHKKYADLQVLLVGEEQVLVSNIANMKIGKYSEDSDYLQCDGNCEKKVKLDKTKCVLLLPEDAHMPGVCIAHQPMKVKKAVFKIPVYYLDQEGEVTL